MTIAALTAPPNPTRHFRTACLLNIRPPSINCAMSMPPQVNTKDTKGHQGKTSSGCFHDRSPFDAERPLGLRSYSPELKLGPTGSLTLTYRVAASSAEFEGLTSLDLRSEKAMASLIEAIDIKRKMFFEFEGRSAVPLPGGRDLPTDGARRSDTGPPQDAQSPDQGRVRQDLQSRREAGRARSRRDHRFLPLRGQSGLPFHGPGRISKRLRSEPTGWATTAPAGGQSDRSDHQDTTATRSACSSLHMSSSPSPPPNLASAATRPAAASPRSRPWKRAFRFACPSSSTRAKR